jgi:DNA gyrase subunit A
VGVALAKPDDVVCVVTSEARALLCKAAELPELANPGRGVTVIKVGEGDEVVGFGVGRPKEKDVLIAELDSGKKIPIGPGRYHVTGRAGRGHALARKATVAKVSLPEAPPPPTLLN